MATENLSTADEIQRQMQSVRSILRADVKELVENARDMTDWHYYVRRYPIACVAAAAAAGFALTSLGTQQSPRGKSTLPEPILNGHAVPVSPSGPSLVQQLLGQVTGIATSSLSRLALSLAHQHLNKLMDGQFFNPPPSNESQEATSDVQSHS